MESISENQQQQQQQHEEEEYEESENTEPQQGPVRHEVLKNNMAAADAQEPLAHVAKVVLGLVNMDNEHNQQQQRDQQHDQQQQQQPQKQPHQSPEYNKSRARVFSQKEIDMHDSLAQTLFNGGYFIKVGRRGKPKAKFLVCSQEGHLFWNDVSGGKTLTSVKLVNVTEIRIGKNTENFRRAAAKNIPEELCLSIVTGDRTVDLQAETQDIRDTWMRALGFGVKNVQDNGRISKAPISTTELERKERDYSEKIKALQLQLSQTNKIIIVKNQEIIAREQQLVLTRRASVEKLEQKDAVLEQMQQEAGKLKNETQELDTKIKRVHHARQASRTVHSRAYQRLEEEYNKLQQEKADSDAMFEAEKEKFNSMIADSQRLLEKAKDTIHKRQLSRAERITAFNEMGQEAEQLRTRNKHLQDELNKAQMAQRMAIKEIQKVKSLIATDTVLPLTEDEDMDDMSGVDDYDCESEDQQPMGPSTGHGGSPAIQRTVVMPPPAQAVEAAAAEVVLKSSELKQPDIWQPDNSSDICLSCSGEFTFFNRRHHCRKCGNLVCNPCSKARMLADTGDKVRVCDICVRNH